MKMHYLLAGLALALLAAPAFAEEPAPIPPAAAPAPPPPPAAPRDSGFWWLLGGSGLVAAGVGNLATSPICFVSQIRGDEHMPCLAASLAFGGAFLAAGVPLIVIGAGKRAQWLKSLTVEPAKSGATVGWVGKF